MLLVPKNDTNLRIRYACSLLCFELPTQNTASAPDSFRIASKRSPTSLIAWSHGIFCHLPLTSFIGDFSRCESSCIPCSRTDAPLAQCAPRLSGESNTGSCRIQTPFWTTASTEQPTEQWVHTVRLVTVSPASPFPSALPTRLNGSWLANAPAPATRPERSKTARRSIVGVVAPARRRRRGRAAPARSETRSGVLVSSMVLPPPTRFLRSGSNAGRDRSLRIPCLPEVLQHRARPLHRKARARRRSLHPLRRRRAPAENYVVANGCEEERQVMLGACWNDRRGVSSAWSILRNEVVTL